MTKLLVITWGNPSRGDDALGPAFLAAVENIAPPAGCSVDFVTDFQLQPEHALDLVGYDQVLFVDAAAHPEIGVRPQLSGNWGLTPISGRFSFSAIVPAVDTTFTSHALSPAAVLATYERVMGSAPPPACVLAIRGESFELGDPISATGNANLDAAVAFYRALIEKIGADPLTASS